MCFAVFVDGMRASGCCGRHEVVRMGVVGGSLLCKEILLSLYDYGKRFYRDRFSVQRDCERCLQRRLQAGLSSDGR